MTRHGAEMHYMRPDGVYITSVLQPTLNYDPVGDSMAVGARFVAPQGLAGPVASYHRRRRSSLGSPVIDGIRARWQAFVARVKTNLATNKLLHDMKFLPPAAVVTVDTSPRPANTDPTALAVKGGWAPTPQTPASAASYMPAQGDPPDMGPLTTAVAMTPEQAAFPSSFWQDVIYGGLPPVVAARGEADALYKWFGVKSPTGGGY